jgi:hypothetical protein
MFLVADWLPHLMPTRGAHYNEVKTAVFSDTILPYSVVLMAVEQFLEMGRQSSDWFSYGNADPNRNLIRRDCFFHFGSLSFSAYPIVWAHEFEAAQTWEAWRAGRSAVVENAQANLDW